MLLRKKKFLRRAASAGAGRRADSVHCMLSAEKQQGFVNWGSFGYGRGG